MYLPVNLAHQSNDINIFVGVGSMNQQKQNE